MEQTSLHGKPETSVPLHVATAGSVDDGKSTLIGRLLYDAELLADDQVETLRKKAVLSGNNKPDFAAITDGLTDERAQGITIDVAYRFVDTPSRRLMIADVPGHEQYTRNMVTGASTADVVIILTDALRGATDQTWRHLCISLLLRIPHVIVAVNKMDLVDYARDRFDAIAGDVRRRAAAFPATQLHFLPISAYEGDNVVHGTATMPWYDGPPLIDLLQSLARKTPEDTGSFLFPVQYVLRPDQAGEIAGRAYMGRISGGRVSIGDRVVILPSGRTAQVRAVERLGRSVPSAAASQSVSLFLDRDIDVARGDVIAAEGDPPGLRSDFNAVLFWLGQLASDTSRRYRLLGGSRTVGARIAEIQAGIDVTGPARTTPPEHLVENGIAAVRMEMQSPLAVDGYRTNRKNGTFILIDEQTNETVAAGIIGGDTVPPGI